MALPFLIRIFATLEPVIIFPPLDSIYFAMAIGRLTKPPFTSHNATSSCGVFVIVDGVRPYQKTTPVGQAGGNDYSKWKYTFTPAYAGTITEGINRITAKLLCQANPTNLTKFYSINVTGMNGIVPKQSVITRSNTSVSPLSSNSSSSLFYQTPLVNHLSLSTNSNSSASIGSSGSLHHNIYGKDHFNGKNSKHHGGYCNYSNYKSNVNRCA
jgi:hypothetical protein